MEIPCGIYENMPIVDTQLWFDDSEKKNCGLVLDSEAEAYSAEKVGESSLKVFWKDKYVLFEESRLVCKTDKIRFYIGAENDDGSVGTEYEHKGNKFYKNPKPKIRVLGDDAIEYEYKGNRYYLNTEGASVAEVSEELIEIMPAQENDIFFLYPESKKIKKGLA